MALDGRHEASDLRADPGVSGPGADSGRGSFGPGASCFLRPMPERGGKLGLLFSDLGTLPELDPGPAFRQDVLREAPVREPTGSAGGGWRARKARRREEASHPRREVSRTTWKNLLSPQPAARLEAHLASCPSCRSEVQEWKGSSVLPAAWAFRSQGGFRRTSHGSGHGSGTGSRAVSVGSPPCRDGLGLGSEPPSSNPPRLGRGRRGGIGADHHLVALIYMVFSRPLLTPGNLGSYLLWKASALFDTLVSAGSSLVSESAVLLRVLSVLEPVAQSPLLLGLGGLVFSLVSAGALWVLYRNLIVTPSDDRYARARV